MTSTANAILLLAAILFSLPLATAFNEWLPVAIFSMRQQLPGHTGPIFRIRRSSDSALADIFLGINSLINPPDLE
jgi:hypothetical protein